jgi:hypothetical protein
MKHKLLLPLQVVLLNKRMCVGCTTPLDKAGNRSAIDEKHAMVQCKCSRRYVLDLESNIYRRATLDEERKFLENARAKTQHMVR